MFDGILAHLAYKISNAVVNSYPMPHIYVEEVFPDDFYAELLSKLPPATDYSTGESNYKGRVFYDPVDLKQLDCFRSSEWLHIATHPFRYEIAKVHGTEFPAATDLRLVLDGENYSIGPHTDAPHKILSYLFYLPSNFSLQEHGTSIYLPRASGFRCKGGPHYPHKDFVKVATFPFRPNSLFAFYKTDLSFHGVENITIPCRRDVLLWNLYKGK